MVHEPGKPQWSDQPQQQLFANANLRLTKTKELAKPS